MTKTTRPSDPDHPRDAEAEHRSWLREQVRHHLLKMAPLALAAVVPLTNTACDWVPPPCKASKSPGDWDEYVTSRASWGEDHGDRVVVLEIKLDDPNVKLPSSYTVVGGSFLTTGKSDKLKIKPDADAKIITLQGDLTCSNFTQPLRITIELEPPDGGSADSAPVVKLTT
jgi:hypothetical protein